MTPFAWNHLPQDMFKVVVPYIACKDFYSFREIWWAVPTCRTLTPLPPQISEVLLGTHSTKLHDKLLSNIYFYETILFLWKEFMLIEGRSRNVLSFKLKTGANTKGLVKHQPLGYYGDGRTEACMESQVPCWPLTLYPRIGARIEFLKS